MRVKLKGKKCLTDKELIILRMLAEGRELKEIAYVLGLDYQTVKCYHLPSIRRKMDAVNNIHATVKAVALGVITVNCLKG